MLGHKRLTPADYWLSGKLTKEMRRTEDTQVESLDSFLSRGNKIRKLEPAPKPRTTDAEPNPDNISVAS